MPRRKGRWATSRSAPGLPCKDTSCPASRGRHIPFGVNKDRPQRDIASPGIY
nr:MAG TPA: hypothetical protein [Caudoviricetes sp.]